MPHLCTRPVGNLRCAPKREDDLLRSRARILQQIRTFFVERNFLEVETPILIPHFDPSPHLASFQTQLHCNEHHQSLALHTSPEFAMKRLVAVGYSRIFQICKFFRNGEISPLHNPEFTGLEWYATGADYNLLMSLTAEMICALCPEQKLTYQGETIDLRPPWEQLTVDEALERFIGIRVPRLLQRADLEQACHDLGLSVNPDDSFEDLFFKLYLTHIEPRLGRGHPTFLKDYPIQMAALARAKTDNPHRAERVELFIAGLELANGYSELTDPVEQQKRFVAEIAFRQARGDPDPGQPDPGLLNALQWGMPNTTGIAVGLDRLIMLLLDAPTIQNVLPFPLQVANTE